MADMFDYLAWRGDLPFSVAPFNEVDNLILSHLAYTHFQGIVPDSGKAIPLSEVRKAFFKHNSREKLKADKFFMSKCPLLLDYLASGERFGNMKLCYYIDEIDDDTTKQISAVTFLLDDGTAYVSYCGTDFSLAGWKEDFYLSYLPVTEGQKRARSYLNRIASEIPRPLRVGGHSKGGNFAMYAATLCAFQNRIIAVYSNDAPGFHENFVHSKSYRSILPKVQSIVPDTPVIGSLFYSAMKHRVVKSSAYGIMQHDGFSWNIYRDHFVRTQISDTGKIVDHTLEDWLAGLNEEKRRFIVDTIFSVFESTGEKNFLDIEEKKLKSIKNMLQFIITIPVEDQMEMLRIARKLILSGGHAALEQLPEMINKKD